MTVSTAIDASFVKHFEAEVHNAYQQQGSKLRNTVRFKGGITGTSTTFQVIGAQTANQKTARNAQNILPDHRTLPWTRKNSRSGPLTGTSE